MKNQIWNALNHLDDDLIENASDDGMRRKKATKRVPMKMLFVAAACVAVVVGVFAVGFFSQDAPETSAPWEGGSFFLETSVTSEKTPDVQTSSEVSGVSSVADEPQSVETSDEVSAVEPTSEESILPPTSEEPYTPPVRETGYAKGNPTLSVIGSPVFGVGGQGEPPAPWFTTEGFVVLAHAVETLPDPYRILGTRREYYMVKMEVDEMIHGEGIPQTFWYLMPSYLPSDLSAYETLLLSLYQCGMENTILLNATTDRAECFPEVFAAANFATAEGEMIAFRDGMFDISLWESWTKSYAWMVLDYLHTGLKNSEYYLKVSIGGTLERTLELVRQEIQEKKDRYESSGREYKEPTVRHFPDNADANEALQIILAMENGVWAHGLSMWGRNLEYVLYVDGLPTDESYIIDFRTGEVRHTGTSYTSEQVASLPDVAGEMERLATLYKTEIPTPPHTNAEGLELRALWLNGWYFQKDGEAYGVLVTSWYHLGRNEYNELFEYFDQQFRLFASDGTQREISLEELTELGGKRDNYLIHFPYGTPQYYCWE